MNVTRHYGLIIGLILCLWITGCSQAPVVMKYDTGTETAEKIVWPEAPETARYSYVGQLTGEQNFHKQKNGQSFGKRILGWLVGLVSGKETPVVLQRPQSGFVDENGRIYVTDVSRSAVFVFDQQQGKLLVWEMAAENIRFVTPLGIVAGADQTILVADAELGSIIQLDQQGNPLGNFGAQELQRPTGLTRDARRGRIYVSDTRDNQIKVFDDNGNHIDTIGGWGEGEGQFNGPTYISFKDDQLYVTDTLNSRVQIFSSDGKLVSTFGKRGLSIGDLPRPKGVAIDQAGNIYVVESYYDYLLVFNNQGQLLLPIGGSGSDVGEFYLPAGVWTDQQDRVYIADAFNGRVVILQYLGAA